MIRQNKNYTRVKEYLDNCKQEDKAPQAAAYNAISRFKYCLSTVKLAFVTVYGFEIEYIGDDGSFSLRPKRNK